MFSKKYNKKVYLINEDADFKKYDDFDDDTEEKDDFNEDLDFDDDSLNEADGDNTEANNKPEPPMDEQKLRIESLKLATNVGKLMNNVTPEDIVTIAGMLAEFIRNNQNGDIDAGEGFTDEEAEAGEENTSEDGDFNESIRYSHKKRLFEADQTFDTDTTEVVDNFIDDLANYYLNLLKDDKMEVLGMGIDGSEHSAFANVESVIDEGLEFFVSYPHYDELVELSPVEDDDMGIETFQYFVNMLCQPEKAYVLTQNVKGVQRELNIVFSTPDTLEDQKEDLQYFFEFGPGSTLYDVNVKDGFVS